MMPGSGHREPGSPDRILGPTAPMIALAGASGDLGFRIAGALVDRGASVRGLVRPDISAIERGRLEALGLEIAKADPFDRDAVAAALTGTTCVISALNGLREVIIGRQGVLLNAAVLAGVPRFISSDYSADFTKTTPGENRNLDLRREFMALADQAPIAVTSILNGAFLDMLGAEMPIIQTSIRKVLYWHDARQKLDFTMKDDVAAYVANAGLDDTTPRILRIVGDSVSADDIAVLLSKIEGRPYRTQWVGGLGVLGAMIAIGKRIAPQPGATFPPWQGMQYMRDMFSGNAKLKALDNDRYQGLTWTSVSQHLARRHRVRVTHQKDTGQAI